jgi:hypothetical protein
MLPTDSHIQATMDPLGHPRRSQKNSLFRLLDTPAAVQPAPIDLALASRKYPNREAVSDCGPISCFLDTILTRVLIFGA